MKTSRYTEAQLFAILRLSQDPLPWLRQEPSAVVHAVRPGQPVSRPSKAADMRWNLPLEADLGSSCLEMRRNGPRNPPRRPVQTTNTGKSAKPGQ